MILVIGATGFLGSEVCRILTSKGQAVQAMVRKSTNQVRKSLLQGRGVHIISGDLRDPYGFERVLQGIEVVITTTSAMPFSYLPGENDPDIVDSEGLINLINASVESGVRHFVYLSFSGNINEDFPLSNAKRAVEEHLKKSGLTFTILRPSYFMEAWLSPAAGFDIYNSSIRVYGDGLNPVSYISLFDVAKFAVKSITTLEAFNSIIEVGGPAQLSQLEVIKIFESIIRHPFKITNVSRDALKSKMISAEDPIEKSFAGMKYCLAKGDPIEMKQTLKKFPMRMKTVEDYARSVLAEVESKEF